MWAKRILLEALGKHPKDAIKLAQKHDLDYEETKLRLAKVEARLAALDAEWPLYTGDHASDNQPGDSISH